MICSFQYHDFFRRIPYASADFSPACPPALVFSDTGNPSTRFSTDGLDIDGRRGLLDSVVGNLHLLYIWRWIVLLKLI